MKAIVDEETCIGCGLCEQVCPAVCHTVTLSRQMVTVRRQIVTLPATPRRICRGKRNGSYPQQTAKMAAEPVASYIRLCLLTRTKMPPLPEAHQCP